MRITNEGNNKKVTAQQKSLYGCAFNAHDMRIQSKPMSKSQKTKPSPVATASKRPLNLTVDGSLAKVFAEYCRLNRKAGSISAEVEEMMIKKVKYFGHRYGLKLPAHLA